MAIMPLAKTKIPPECSRLNMSQGLLFPGAILSPVLVEEKYLLICMIRYYYVYSRLYITDQAFQDEVPINFTPLSSTDSMSLYSAIFVHHRHRASQRNSFFVSWKDS